MVKQEKTRGRLKIKQSLKMQIYSQIGILELKSLVEIELSQMFLFFFFVSFLSIFWGICLGAQSGFMELEIQ